MREKYVGKAYNLFIVSIIATMLVSIIVTVMSSISYSDTGASEITSIVANNDESYTYKNDGAGAIAAPNYASVSNLNNNDVALTGANYVSENLPKFSLVDYIPLNTKIKDQKATNTCWTFSTLSSIQTNLALNDYLSNKPAYEYDYSERHVSLASIETTLNNTGYNRSPIDGATYWMAMNYFTKSMGPVLEEECPFSEDNTTVPTNSNTYKLNQAATVTDIKMFPSPNSAGYNADTNINNMKTYIRTKGALCATMYFPPNNYYSDSTFNANKGASYVYSDSIYQINHMISIVGWDDNYSKDNFNSSHKPSRDGAWLIRNSHGNFPITDNGFLHISYEDKLIYGSVFGMEKTDLAKNYSQVIGYNEKGNNFTATVPSNSYSLYTVFDRNKNNSINELIDSVSLYVLDDCTVSIAIAEGNYSSNRNIDFRTQTLKGSNSAAPGFRTFNLKTPYRFNTTSSNASGLDSAVTVRVTITSTNNLGSLKLPLECGLNRSYISEMSNASFYSNLRDITGTTRTETNRCFMGYGSYAALDLGKWHNNNAALIDADSTIQINLVEGTKPTGELAVKTNPTKTRYNVGENFNSAGLSLKYNAGHGSTLNIKLDDCTLKKNTSLTAGQSAVEVYGYGAKVDVPIIVGNAEEMTPILTIKTNPTKTSYTEGENFDKTGLVLKYTHGNPNSPTVDEIPASSVTIIDGTNLKENQTSVTAKYNNVTTQIPITVISKMQALIKKDKDNLKNLNIQLNVVKLNSKNASGFDDFTFTLTSYIENTGANYKYSVSVANNQNENERVLVDTFDSNSAESSYKLTVSSDKIGSSFKLKTEDDVIYVTVTQLNTTTGNSITRTIQVKSNENTVFHINGVIKDSKNTGNQNSNPSNNNNSDNENNNNNVKNNSATDSENKNQTESNPASKGSNNSGATTPTTVTGDSTIATKKIPQTGTAEEIFKIVIISIALIAGAFIVKSYVINKNINGK